MTHVSKFVEDFLSSMFNDNHAKLFSNSTKRRFSKQIAICIKTEFDRHILSFPPEQLEEHIRSIMLKFIPAITTFLFRLVDHASQGEKRANQRFPCWFSLICPSCRLGSNFACGACIECNRKTGKCVYLSLCPFQLIYSHGGNPQALRSCHRCEECLADNSCEDPIDILFILDLLCTGLPDDFSRANKVILRRYLAKDEWFNQYLGDSCMPLVYGDLAHHDSVSTFCLPSESSQVSTYILKIESPYFYPQGVYDKLVEKAKWSKQNLVRKSDHLPQNEKALGGYLAKIKQNQDKGKKWKKGSRLTKTLHTFKIPSQLRMSKAIFASLHQVLQTPLTTFNDTDAGAAFNARATLKRLSIFYNHLPVFVRRYCEKLGNIDQIEEKRKKEEDS